MNFRKALLEHRGSTVFETKSGSLFIEESEVASVAVVVLHEGNLTLVRQYRHQMDQQTIELPGGGLEHGEQPENGAKRELDEETGITVDRLTYLGPYHPQPYFTNRLSHLFFTNSIKSSGNQKLNDDEEIEVIQMPLNDVLKSIQDGKIQDGELGYALFLCQLNGYI
ncbi:NUDIX hydrolase [Alkalihalobacillus sp. TS-13]|uniref:NUDIX hydrolase n=1 Tax=Alkalihalobacillus sp. TS-13 TaxID=2842455 RepID=UPI001C86ACE3|nr:NUDIX hydrolase [Alkalihalobacillus sp. TS-13]